MKKLNKLFLAREVLKVQAAQMKKKGVFILSKTFT